ncbi:cyclic nucleotide-regulated ABC bacteriocin/lantibiotic exporter [Nostoc commune NIES-4072]|uniref:Cyclic nucleotide-regulated ABC bacteriocin/lantibiotic exporter n=1 Tax=Nostoc commune NIES-4072 TaxID=2005467 RepID=A0A2R5FYT3_NOSCO|nr:peptidase domain-containing ABC transporter [Nostoc commune]BBD70781.1 cyclic nucleotide-regulated ABC bacteriocin/lantibiotic exporter [Nostoc commune HK-02]GBG23435.1 cyclic nucleotide-regulated ABC bacteriocin/lantibiotic exporter [Nostoc commune NIES-4072]
MIQNKSTFQKQQLGQQLTQILGQPLSEQELSNCFQQIEILEPNAGKLFWQASDATVGIYIILAGKVRLLNTTDNLIASLGVGASFGEITLFPESGFQPYTARASVNLKVCYIPGDCLRSLIRKYPAIAEHLHSSAVLWDLLVLCRQIPCLANAPVEALMQILPLLEQHNLQIGKLPSSLLKDQQLWLLRRGELLHTSGCKLTVGNIYAVEQLPKERTWQVTQPSQIYSLSRSHWESAIAKEPQLAELINSNTPLGDGKTRKEDTGMQRQRRRVPIDAPAVDTRTPIPNSQYSSSRKKISKAYFPNPTVKIGHFWQRITRRYPYFEQQSASDCGAACLVMVGRYWGKRFSINTLRDIANVDRNGASLRGLAAAAESIGFSTRPVKASLDKLALQSLPAIVHWEGRHYIVVYEVTGDRVIVADPAIGQRTLSHTDFKAGWTGYTLLIQPTALLKDAKEASTPFWQFFELAKPHWLVLLEVFIASILLQIFGLITPLFTQLLLDRVVVQRSDLTLTAVGIGLLIFSLFRVAMTGLRQYLLDHTANRVDLALIVGFISHTFRLPLNYFESRYVGDIISRVQENRKIQRFLTGEALSIVLDLLTVFIYVGLMFWYSWKMALLVLVIVPPFVLLALIATPFLQRVSREIFSAYNEETAYLIQSLTGIRTVKSMAVEQSVRWHWEELFGKSIKKNFSGQVIGNTLQIFSSGIEAVVTTVLLWFGAWQVIQNELTIGQLVAFNMLLGNVINPFQRLIMLWNELQEVLIAVERINDVIDAEPEEDLHSSSRQSLPPIRGYIAFDKVTFRYHPESDVNTLENISFEVRPGQMIALVGRSGSGKTTISKLVLGLYPPTEGKILIDGYDTSSLSLRSLRSQIGVVDQDTFLFGGTIRENISLGYPEATLEEVIEAAQQAGAHEFIKELPMSYETQIGEGGGTLSGGQRQRLAIARALVGNPQLLILDEATSSLDAESERIIQTNLNKILQDRTTLVIAHRLSTVRNADKILVLDRGLLVESGTHDQLMAKRGHYFYLNQQQLTIAV